MGTLGVEVEDLAGHVGAVGFRLLEEWMNEAGGDVRLWLRDKSELIHGCLLATFSPRLADSVATAPRCPEGLLHLTLPDSLSRRGLFKALEWLYSGRCSVNLDCLTELWEATSALDLVVLRKKLEDYILATPFTPEHLPIPIRLLYRHQCSYTTKFCFLRFCLHPQNFSGLRETADFAGLPFHFYRHILSSDNLPVESEVEALQMALAHLATFQDFSFFRMNLLLDQIRFNAMRQDELESVRRLLPAIANAAIARRVGEYVELAERGYPLPGLNGRVRRAWTSETAVDAGMQASSLSLVASVSSVPLPEHSLSASLPVRASSTSSVTPAPTPLHTSTPLKAPTEASSAQSMPSQQTLTFTISSAATPCSASVAPASSAASNPQRQSSYYLFEAKR